MNNKPVTLMFVEDDEATLKMILLNIALWGIINPLISFKTCEEALAFLEAQPSESLPEVLFLDRIFNYSGMQGDDLLAKLRAQRRYEHVNIAIMTADLMNPEMRDKYASAGCQGYFSKSVEFADLNEFVIELGYKIQYTKTILPQENAAA